MARLMLCCSVPQRAQRVLPGRSWSVPEWGEARRSTTDFCLHGGS